MLAHCIPAACAQSNIELLTSKCVYTKYACAWTFSAIWCDTVNVQPLMQHWSTYTENWSVHYLFIDSICESISSTFNHHFHAYQIKMSVYWPKQTSFWWSFEHSMYLYTCCSEANFKWNFEFSNSTNTWRENLFRFNFSMWFFSVYFHWNIRFCIDWADVRVFAN